MAMERKFKSYTEGAVRPGWSGDVIGSYALRIGCKRTLGLRRPDTWFEKA
jgi:hypothetical protein